MNIAFILPFRSASGGVKIVIQYASILRKKGHSVKIYVPVIPYRFGYQLKNFKASFWQLHGILSNLIKGPFVYLPPEKYSISFIPWISDLFIKEPDVIVATAWPTAFSVFQMKFSKAEKYYFIQGYEIYTGPKEKIIASYNLPLNKIVLSSWLTNIMIDKYCNKKIYKVNNGIDINFFSNSEKEYHDNPQILMHYSPYPWKGGDDGLQILTYIKKKYPKVKIVTFGRKKVKTLPLNFNYHVNPSKHLLKKLYCQSDIFLFTSKSEGSPLPPLEAMACKCALVGTKVGAVPEYAENLISALLYEPDDIDALKNGVELLIQNLDLRKKISLEGEKAAKKMSIEDAVNEFEVAIS